MGPGRKDQEKCVLIIEGGRLLGYTYFYLASDGLDRPFLKREWFTWIIITTTLAWYIIIYSQGI